MAARGRISAAKARMHTRKAEILPWPLSFLKLWCRPLLALVVAVLVSGAVLKVRPPQPKVCGTPGGPPITAPRLRLSDGRYLAYKEGGLAKDQAKHKVVLVHAYGRSRHDVFPVSKEIIDKQGVYFVSYDRAGYGQSDPNPGRSLLSEARDVEELADFLQLGPRFYVIAHSIGGYTGWSCIKYIPHRLQGVAMVVPVVNYWWPSVAGTQESNAVFSSLPVGDRLFLRVAHYAPWLVHWWMTQKIFPTSSTVNHQQAEICPADREARERLLELADPSTSAEAVQQGLFESMNRDVMVAFGSWEFDPAEVDDPGVPVHIWQGEKDYLVPSRLQRMVAAKHKWIQYHELADHGHFVTLSVPGIRDRILETLLSS